MFFIQYQLWEVWWLVFFKLELILSFLSLSSMNDLIAARIEQPFNLTPDVIIMCKKMLTNPASYLSIRVMTCWRSNLHLPDINIYMCHVCFRSFFDVESYGMLGGRTFFCNHSSSKSYCQTDEDKSDLEYVMNCLNCL